MIEKVSDLNKIVWAKLASSLWSSTEEELLEAFNKNYYQNEFLYIDNNHYAGFISLSLRNDYVEGTDSSPVAYVEGIYVEAAYQKKGIARTLIEFAKAWAKNNGCQELASDAELTNTESIAFHKKIGFEEKKRIVCFAMKVEKK